MIVQIQGLKNGQNEKRKKNTNKKSAATPTFCKQNFSRIHHIDFVHTLCQFLFLCLKPGPRHTVNFGSEMVEALKVSIKNVYCSLNVEKVKEKRIF